MTMAPCIAIVISVLTATTVTANSGPDWTTDFAAAKAAAAESGRNILIEFTGSDWCGWCIRLHDETLSTDRFADWAKPKFLLLQLDYPRDTSAMAPELIEQNAELRARYGPGGFPTIVFADAEGMPYARLVGYKPQDTWFEEADGLLGRKQQRDEALRRASALEGRDRAAALRETLDALDAADARAYTDIITEIHQLEFPHIEAIDPAVALRHYMRTRREPGKPGDPDAPEAPGADLIPLRVQAPPAQNPAEHKPAEHNLDEFRTIVEQLGGMAGRGGPDVTTPEFQLGVARALAYRYRIGEWPTGAAGNRTVLALMAWAETQSDLALFEALLAEMPTVRRNLGGNEQFIGRLQTRLDTLRAGTAEGTFYEWLLTR